MTQKKTSFPSGSLFLPQQTFWVNSWYVLATCDADTMLTSCWYYAIPMIFQRPRHVVIVKAHSRSSRACFETRMGEVNSFWEMFQFQRKWGVAGLWMNNDPSLIIAIEQQLQKVNTIFPLSTVWYTTSPVLLQAITSFHLTSHLVAYRAAILQYCCLGLHPKTLM